MRAVVGDRMVTASPSIDRPVRDGEVLEVRGPDGSGPYLVRWSDSGVETLFWPGSDSHVEHAEHAEHAELNGTPPAHATAGHKDVALPHVKTWRVDIHLYERDGATTAQAVLHGESPTSVQARGEAHRRPTDQSVPEIGDEVAVSRALRRLAERLLDVAAEDITAISGEPVRLAP